MILEGNRVEEKKEQTILFRQPLSKSQLQRSLFILFLRRSEHRNLITLFAPNFKSLSLRECRPLGSIFSFT